MKLAKTDHDRLWLQLGRRERSLLLEVLGSYPLVDSTYHRATRSADPRVDQPLLEEALTALKQENQERLAAFLAAPQRFREIEGEGFLVIEFQDLEWLLQVVNDLRVGNWLKLGSPDANSLDQLTLDLQRVRYVVAMELCGVLEAVLLEASFERPAT